ncbi:MAG: hypothetical protein IPG04_24820 [Polyangiaceae bacterium]|nr:hypothetical protein [Polyangiaceae bacterium]
MVPAPKGFRAESRVQAATPDGSLVASAAVRFGPGGSRAGALSIWDGKTGDVRFTAEPTVSTGFLGGLNSDFADILDAAFSPSGETLAIAQGYNCSVSLLDSASGAIKTRLSHGSNVNALAWDATSGRLVTGTSSFTGDSAVRVFEPDGKLRVRFEHEDSVQGVGFLRGGAFAISSSSDGTLRIWDIETEREAARLVFFPDGRWIAVDPEGRFDTNDIERLEGASWSAPGRPLSLLPIEAFLRDYYEPGLVRRILQRAPLDPGPRPLHAQRPPTRGRGRRGHAGARRADRSSPGPRRRGRSTGLGATRGARGRASLSRRAPRRAAAGSARRVRGRDLRRHRRARRRKDRRAQRVRLQLRRREEPQRSRDGRGAGRVRGGAVGPPPCLRPERGDRSLPRSRARSGLCDGRRRAAQQRAHGGPLGPV